MTRIIRYLIKHDDASSVQSLSSKNFARGVGSVISLNAQTDFEGRIASLRLTDQQVLTKDARCIGQDMWNALEG